MNAKVTSKSPADQNPAHEHPTERDTPPTDASTGHRWTFLSNHTHVLLCLAIDGDQRVRDIADRVGLTERAVQRILADLEEAGNLERERVGRRNRYTLRLDAPLRHPLEAHHTVGELLDLLCPDEPARTG